MFAQGTEEGDVPQLPDFFQKEGGIMVTYSDLFAFVSMLCSVVTLVVTLLRQK